MSILKDYTSVTCLYVGHGVLALVRGVCAKRNVAGGFVRERCRQNDDSDLEKKKPQQSVTPTHTHQNKNIKTRASFTHR